MPVSVSVFHELTVLASRLPLLGGTILRTNQGPAPRSEHHQQAIEAGRV